MPKENKKIREVLEKLYLDNRGDVVRGDYKEFIDIALSFLHSILDEVIGEGIESYNRDYQLGYNEAKREIRQRLKERLE
jgi:hypothetical protein